MENLNNAIINLLNRSLSGDRESAVTALVYGMLSEAKKDYLHGYLIESVRHINGGVADVAVEVTLDERKILVIECKINSKSFKKGKIQLSNHMTNGYPVGILICGEITEVYSLDLEDDNAIPILIDTYTNHSQLHELIEYIRNL
ncbi:hypothetical protein BB561_003154 [Smittium simulii]|uniref:Restriction endonuclease type IV Mrr domain-containing protein n=1 Tax=Smittium simulii TaxID=133385 RepID=A0A2T9YMP5_9FUNG|nr:hypothetical protein BB561_003154 [Smittium simulii]